MPPLLPPKDCVPCGGKEPKLKVRADDVEEIITDRFDGCHGPASSCCRARCIGRSAASMLTDSHIHGGSVLVCSGAWPFAGYKCTTTPRSRSSTTLTRKVSREGAFALHPIVHACPLRACVTAVLMTPAVKECRSLALCKPRYAVGDWLAIRALLRSRYWHQPVLLHVSLILLRCRAVTDLPGEEGCEGLRPDAVRAEHHAVIVHSAAWPAMSIVLSVVHVPVCV
jgi:hypothetical protein